MLPLSILNTDKMLILAPHPDDECIGSGGILSLYPKQCHVWVLTDGAIGQRNISPDTCRRIRSAEFVEEMEYLNLCSDRYKLLNYPDGELYRHLSCLEDLDLSCYTKIFITGEQDHHIDHTTAFHCLYRALKKQNIHDAEIYCYEVHNAMNEPTHYLDITETIDEKMRLIQFHKSQLGELPYDLYAETSAKYRALQNRMAGKYIEVYTKVLATEHNEKWSHNQAAEEDLQKFKLFYSVLTNWMLLPAKSRCGYYLQKRNISSCVIYGYAELGKILYKDLKGYGIEVSYIIDMKQAGRTNQDGIPIISLTSQADCNLYVIVTAVYYFDDIKKKLFDYGYCNVISLKEIIKECR